MSIMKMVEKSIVIAPPDLHHAAGCVKPNAEIEGSRSSPESSGIGSEDSSSRRNIWSLVVKVVILKKIGFVT